MNFRRIDENTIECSISGEEMRAMGYSMEELMNNKEATIGFADKVMRMAYDRVNYIPKGNSIAVQVMARSDGDMVLTFTDMGANSPAYDNFLNYLRNMFGRNNMPDYEAFDEDEMFDEEDEENDFRNEIEDMNEEENGNDKFYNGNSGVSGKIPPELFEAIENTLRAIGEMSQFFDDSSKQNHAGNVHEEDQELKAKREELLKEQQKQRTKYLSQPRAFSFDTIEEIRMFAKHIPHPEKITSELYKNEDSGKYYILIKKGRLNLDKYFYVCEMATEYGTFVSQEYYVEPILKEHYKCLIKSKALKVLSEYDF